MAARRFRSHGNSSEANFRKCRALTDTTTDIGRVALVKYILRVSRYVENVRAKHGGTR